MKLEYRKMAPGQERREELERGWVDELVWKWDPGRGRGVGRNLPSLRLNGRGIVTFRARTR